MELSSKLSLRRASLFILAALFVAAGGNHFLNPDFYVRIMPPYLPAHLELVYMSGVIEILGGIALLIPTIRAMAGWGLIILLLAIFPANIHMAVHPEQFPGVPAYALYLRLPFQFLLIAWAYWVSRPDR